MRVYDAITMTRRVGCGNIFVIFNEHDGEFYNLIIKGDNTKEAPCGDVWFNAVAAILTYALRRSVSDGTTYKGVVRHLRGHRCNMFVPNKDKIQSCTDAIGQMVLEYVKARTDEIKEEEPAQASIS